MAEHLKPIIEALIFASPEPLPQKTLLKLLESEPKEDVEAALALLRQDYDRPGGLQLVEVAGGYQIVTRPELHEYVRRLFHERTSQKLSVQSLETLAVIAYKQPITAPEITEIRGVNTSGVLNTLIERKLVKIVGRKAVVGRPFMYATTREFLDKFGLNDITDLPKVEDLADVLGFDPPSLDTEPTAQPLAFDFDSAGEGAAPAEEGAGAEEAAPVDDDTVAPGEVAAEPTSDDAIVENASGEEAVAEETIAEETIADDAAIEADEPIVEEAEEVDVVVTEEVVVEDVIVEEDVVVEEDVIEHDEIEADTDAHDEAAASDDASASEDSEESDSKKLVRDGESS